MTVSNTGMTQRAEATPDALTARAARWFTRSTTAFVVLAAFAAPAAAQEYDLLIRGRGPAPA